jgi:hypothetical protein
MALVVDSCTKNFEIIISNLGMLRKTFFNTKIYIFSEKKANLLKTFEVNQTYDRLS